MIAAVDPGSYASLAAVPVDHLVPVPDAVGLREAAALVHDAVTALALLDLTALKAGETVLITGASGGMGTLLVQLARSRGARVVGVARGAEKLSLVRELGAHEVVDAALPDWPRHAAAALGGGADVVLDGVGGALGAAAFPLTAPGGRFSAHGAPTGHGFATIPPEEAGRRSITLLGIADVQLPLRGGCPWRPKPWRRRLRAVCGRWSGRCIRWSGRGRRMGLLRGGGGGEGVVECVGRVGATSTLQRHPHPTAPSPNAGWSSGSPAGPRRMWRS